MQPGWRRESPGCQKHLNTAAKKTRTDTWQILWFVQTDNSAHLFLPQPSSTLFLSWPWCFSTNQISASRSITSQTSRPPPPPEKCQFPRSRWLKWAEIIALLSMCEGGRVSSSDLIKSNYHMTYTRSWTWCSNKMSHVTEDLD